MPYENILIEREENIAVITINRPQVLNTLNSATLAEMMQALAELESVEDIRAIVITGAGEKAFVAGADINELRAIPSASAGEAKSREGHLVLFKIEHLSKPVIMALNGYTLGGGCELAMAGDIRIAADTAKFGQPEINLGIIPGWGGTQRLPRLVGLGKAKLLILSGEIIDAQEALRIGLVDKVVPAAELLATAKSIAKTIASKAPLAVALAKRTINTGLEMDLERGCAFEAAQFGLVCATEDRLEGMSAFLEKRRPTFKGR
ncbi:MAG: enoyl-CoA hydratase-related protein [Chloroflexi bacterium]|nr:enoyl-CoA hydratase-related protein [Chloroflexota bacterium]MCL5075232.1 enoyl-CoA hydratase-related protein [Chloroflexota bacterium]